MKTKLFYLFLAVFLFSVNGKAQTNAKTSGAYLDISLIGPGSPSGSWEVDTNLSTTDGNVYTGVDLQLREGPIQIRYDHSWALGNVYTPTSGTGWPNGSGLSEGIGSLAIQSPGGVWTVTFTKSTQSWEFTPGTPNTVVQLVGTAVTATPVTMSTNDGVKYFLKKVALVAGNCQFNIDENGDTTTGLVGGTEFPNGLAQSPTDNIPVETAADYDVSFDMTDGAYTFTLASFPQISIVGDGAGGWGVTGVVDTYVMTTTDGVTYTLNYIPLTTGQVQFRKDNAWDTSYGGDTWPSGDKTSGGIPAVQGYYNVTFNRSTGAYSFLPHTISVVGDGVGSWGTKEFVMTTGDGENYTLNGLKLLGGDILFIENHAYNKYWGAASWPSGGSIKPANIPSVAGTYNVTFNRLTGAYDFGTALGVKNFNAGIFKAYPNPAQNSWTISSGNERITSVQVFDIQGKSVYAKSNSSNDVSVNASSLSKGTYFAKVSTEKGTSTVKLIKE